MSNVVEVRSRGYLTQEVRAGKHVLAADEPREDGGGDTGPNPYELLLAALGACTAMTVQLYARRKGWGLEEVRVALSQERLHGADCAGCDERDVRVDRIRKRLWLRGVLDEAQRQRLREIAERCPVNRTLEGEVRMEMELVPPLEPWD